jgi:hypothetical protein
MVKKSETLSWDDVLPAAQIAFCIWVGRPELRWAKKAWMHIVKAGLAEYKTGAGYCKACIRFLSLADLYYDWCYVAFEEDHSNENIDSAAEQFGMMDFHLGQLIVTEKGKDNFDDDDFVESAESAISVLMYDYRKGVVQAIMNGFGGQQGLYASLCLSNQNKKWDLDAGTDITNISFPMPSELSAWEWIDDGCYPYR